MATQRGSLTPQKKPEPENGGSKLSPKVIGAGFLVLVAVAFVGYQVANTLGYVNKPKPTTDPAVIDPISTYNEKEKKEYEQIQKQQEAEAQQPNRPPPSGS